MKYLIMNKWLTGFIVLVVAIGGYFLWINNHASKQVSSTPNLSKDVTIGAVLAMSGYAAADGEDIKNGIELAKTDLAKNGITLNVDYFDDGTDSKNSITGFHLLDSKGIKFIIGPTWGFQVGAILPVIKNKDVAVFLPVQSSDNVIGTSSRVFFAKPSTAKKQVPTEDWLKKVGAKKVAIFVAMFSGDNWSEGHIKMWTDSVKNSGAELTSIERITLDQETGGIQTLLLKAKNQGVDTILWTGTDGGAIALIKGMQQLNFKASVLGTTQIEEVISKGDVASGGISLYSLMGNTSADFSKEFRSAYGNGIRFNYAEEAYDLTMIAVQNALSDTGSVAVADQVRKNTSYNGFGGLYTFDSNGDRPAADWKVVEVK